MMQEYLEASEYIDWRHPAILEQNQALTGGLSDPLEITKICFEWVRDEIRHSFDAQDDGTTCRASEVLLQGTGYCYAKSHLLAALLRASGVPAGLCYQRLTRDDAGPPFCLHGLNAVYLPDFGWHRIDARGNKPGVDAQFCPPEEKLAYPVKEAGEADLPEIWAEPLPLVTTVLETHKSWQGAWKNLPDIHLLTF